TITFLPFVSLDTTCRLLDLHSFPTRRSSDLIDSDYENIMKQKETLIMDAHPLLANQYVDLSEKITKLESTFQKYSEANKFERLIDRKSTRLNSSHVSISYAVFCLKKKRQQVK